MAKKEIDSVEVSDKNIIAALEIIQQVCDSSVDCDECPFFTDPECGITDSSPDNWRILGRFQALG